MTSETDETRIDTIRDIEKYNGDKECGYCQKQAEFLVTAKTATKKVRFLGCHDCLNQNAIYPHANGWIGPDGVTA